jgi:cytochrome P450
MASIHDDSDGAFDLHLTNSHHRIDFGKNPVQLGYLHVLIKYRPAAVEKFLEWAHQNYGDVIKYHWKSSVISIGNHEIATHLLKHPNFQRKGTFTETVTILNPFSLVSISGPEWTRAHWLMVRAIGRISIHNMCCHVRSAVQRLVCSSPLLLGNQVDLYDFTKKVTLEAMISQVFGAEILEGECHIIHAGIEAIIGELQGLTQASSQYRVNRQRLDALVDAKIEFEYMSVIHSTRFHKDSVSLSSTFPPRHFSTVATDDSQFDSECHFLRSLVEHNASNNRSPSKASQTPLSLIQLRDLVINVMLFMGTINPAEACVHATIEIFRSKWSVDQRHLWIETEELIRKPDSLDREAGFNRILRESLRMFPPVAGLSFNRRATADTVIHGWRFKKDVSLFFLTILPCFYYRVSLNVLRTTSFVHLTYSIIRQKFGTNHNCFTPAVFFIWIQLKVLASCRFQSALVLALA